MAAGAGGCRCDGDGECSHANFLRIRDDVDEHRLRLRPAASGAGVPPPASDVGP